MTPHTSTLVFEDTLRPGYFLEWNDFPYPLSLRRDGRYFGEIWMTVAFSPARGARWGTEYCETHIDAHFGVYRRERSRETGQFKPKPKFVGLVPPEHKNRSTRTPASFTSPTRWKSCASGRRCVPITGTSGRTGNAANVGG